MIDDVPAAPRPKPPPAAKIRRPRFSLVWIIPIVALVIALYLGYRTISEQGPLLTLMFDTGDGVTAGQTQVKYKDVILGTVENIDLSSDNTHVVISIRMNNVGARFLNADARYWIVRPTFSAAGISGLDTLISGAYIAVDPGKPGGKYQDSFVGLEGPPSVRSDEPGRTYVLHAENIGSLSSGSPVFYRNIVVGEVLGYNIGNGIGPVTINIFVRAPYDDFVRPLSHFWNTSGFSVNIKNGTVNFQVQSLQAIFAGGVAFDLPPEMAGAAPSPNNASFPLYSSQDAADSASYQRTIPLVAYFQTSVSGLAPGAPVEVLGIQVGAVTNVSLIVNPLAGIVKVRVAMELQPERLFSNRLLPNNVTLADGIQLMVNKGMRVRLETANYVTGQEIIALEMVPGATPAKISQEGDSFVLPVEPGALDNALVSLGIISTKLSKIPFDKIGNNLNNLLLTTNNKLAGANINQTLAELSVTLKNANTLLNGVSQSYGNDSDFQRNLEQLMEQANSTLLSINLLASYLDRHPEALLLGRQWSMSHSRRAFLSAGSALLAASALAGCTSAPTNYYRIAVVPGAIRSGAPGSIGVRSVSIPGYLSQNGIAKPSSGYEFGTYSNEVWAEPLDGMLQSVMVQDLSQRLPASSVLGAGGSIGLSAAALVEINVLNFDPDSSGQVVLTAQIAIRSGRYAGDLANPDVSTKRLGGRSKRSRHRNGYEHAMGSSSRPGRGAHFGRLGHPFRRCALQRINTRRIHGGKSRYSLDP